MKRRGYGLDLSPEQVRKVEEIIDTRGRISKEEMEAIRNGGKPIERGQYLPQNTGGNIYGRVRKGKPPDLPYAVRSPWEANVYRVLLWQAENRVLPVSAVFYEPIRLWFPKTEGTRQYNPDFMIITSEIEEGWRYVEVKGRLDSKGLTKIRAFKKYYPEQFRTTLFITSPQAGKKIAGLGHVEAITYADYKKAFGSFVNWQSTKDWDDMMRMLELAEDDERAGPNPF